MPTGDFTNQADAYGRARPGYPSELLDRLIARAEISPGDPVADIGAGTGLFTRLLAERGFRVTAVEPNAEMQKLAPRLHNVRWLEGSFAETGLSDESQRWVTAAQAFHWATPATALPELRRVLKEGSSLTVLWNDRENELNPTLSWTRAAIRRIVPEFEEAYRDVDWSGILTSTGDFTDVAYDEQLHTVPMSRSRYLDLWRSHHRLTVSAGPERFESILREVESHLDEQRLEMIEVPYRCRAWWARRT